MPDKRTRKIYVNDTLTEKRSAHLFFSLLSLIYFAVSVGKNTGKRDLSIDKIGIFMIIMYNHIERINQNKQMMKQHKKKTYKNTYCKMRFVRNVQERS